jgi:fibronectin type 3 domain-containing protein
MSSDVVSGTTYTYTGKAYNGSAWSGFDARGVSATAKDAFGAPVLKSAGAGTNGITVTWNAVSGAKSYRVYRKTDSGWLGLGDVTGTSYTDADVIPGVTYTYTVKAWNGTSWSGFDAKGVSAAAK